ncbi:MAG: response regulator [Anaerolineales bacterium]|nr:response regulator [Anaerolineales bacterium]
MKKILIVDDDISITILLEKILSRAGFNAVVVNESAQAMVKARELKPDLFILDLMMPQPNGFEVCGMLRADKTFAEAPILIITASDDYDSKAIAYAAGANDYITKPFDHEELIKRIKALIGK